MLDLVVEAAEHEVGEPAAGNLPGRDHLPRAKLAAVAVSMSGIPLWLGAKLKPRYTEKTACCTAMNASALTGESTSSTTVRYTAACTAMREPSTAAARSRCRNSRLTPRTCIPRCAAA